jgi:iron-sulfur cluster assembly accessory protein
MALTVTEAAASKASELLRNAGKEHGAIRVYIKAGGCSGYQYGMAIDDRRLAGDTIFADKGITLVVDQKSLSLLDGSQVDYVENLMGGGFSIVNPNATSSCGCGHSFRTDHRQAPESEGAPSCH